MNGETLDEKYKIVRLIGQGGMGSVYEAEHTGTHRRVAVKVISGDLAKRSRDLVNRFQREAKAASAIDTEHIARVLDAGTDPTTGAPYLAMEYLEGEDLQQLIERAGPLPPAVALKIVAQACVGLDKAHAARVVHRDIKPANLFLARCAGGEIIVKLLDFGIAKIKGDPVRGLKTSDLTNSGSILGSPLFMSPEQVQDAKTLDYRTDLWSLGVVLYCALAGRAPHEDIKNFATLIIALCEGAPPPIQEAAPWVSPEVAAVVHGALQKDPASRFSSAIAMLDAIKPLLRDGFALDEDMIVPLEIEARSVVAPRLDRTTASLHLDGPPMTGTETTEELVAKQVVAVRESSPQVSGTETTEQVAVAKKKPREAPPAANEPAAPAAPARSRVPLVIAAVLTVGLGAFALDKTTTDTYLSRADSEHEFKTEDHPSEDQLADQKREARAHFERGNKLADEGAWASALDEFFTSRKIYPTRSATVNAAVCLKKLKRFDEAFDLLEPLLDKDSSPPENFKDRAFEQ